MNVAYPSSSAAHSVGLKIPHASSSAGPAALLCSGRLAPLHPLPADEQHDAEAAQPLQVTPPSAESPRPEAERRQLTVLFCDLVDSTALATHLDPEELREVVRAYQRVCAEVIQRFEGYIAQYLGDGLLVYFGYPQAHEDDGQRAVRAALGMMEAMGRLNQHLEQERGVRLAVRVGIHTGLVVVGEMGGGGRQEQLALGETPNVAARLQALAAPDTVVISAATQRLVQGLFTCQDLGLHTLRGVATPMQVFHVLRESEAQSRLDVAVSRGLTPLVGREQEVRLLLERWAQVKDGHGQVVLLSGEAGIGKSRLVEVVKERVAGELHTRFEWRGSPYYQQSPLYPVIAHLHHLLRWHQEESPHERLRKLEKVMRQSGFSLPDVVPLFASLLALPLPDSYPAARPDARTAETEDPGSPAGVATAGSGAAAGPVDHRRPPLAGCLHLGVSQPPGGPGGHYALVHAAHLSPDVPPAMASARTRDPSDTKSFTPSPGGAPDRAGGGWQGVAGGGAPTIAHQHRWCAAVCGRIDQNGLGVRLTSEKPMIAMS